MEELGVAYCLILSVVRETTERARKLLILQKETVISACDAADQCAWMETSKVTA